MTTEQAQEQMTFTIWYVMTLSTWYNGYPLLKDMVVDARQFSYTDEEIAAYEIDFAEFSGSCAVYDEYKLTVRKMAEIPF